MKAGPLGVSASIWALVVGAGLASSSIEQGLFLDFTSSAFQSTTGFYGSANVIDYTTPSNNYYSSPDKQASSFLTYTSPSPKIVMGPSGTLQFAPHNLALQSDNLTASWSITGGSSSATTFTEDTSTGNHQFRQIISLGNGFRHAVSIDLTPNGRNYFLVEVVSGVTDEYSYINLIDGTIITGSGTTTITSQGNGKYRVRILFTSAAATATFFVFCQNGAGPGAGVSYTGNGVSGVIAGRAQCYRYPADSTYLATTTTVRYGLPFEWNTAGDLQGIVQEEQRTNTCIYSTSIGGPSWINSGSPTVTLNAAVSPDGQTTATNIVGSASYSIYQIIAVSASTQYTFSFYAKNNSGTDAKYRVYDNSNSAEIIPPTSFLSQINNSTWVRISVTFTTPVGCTSILIYPGSSAVLGGNYYVWQSQNETGDNASSPIITAASTVTRVADIFSLATSAFPIGTAHTLVVSGSCNTLTGNATFASLYKSLGGNVMRTGRNTTGADTTKPDYYIQSGGADQAYQSLGTALSIGTVFKIGFAAETNNVIGARGGSLGTLDTTAAIPNTPVTLCIGNETNSITQYANGYIKTIIYLPRRVSNTQLQTLTTI